MNCLLMITYYFPPMGGAGVQRALKFVHYLPDFGCSPVILAGVPESGAVLDPTLMAQIPEGLVSSRVKGYSLPRWLPWRLRSWIIRWFLVVDEQLGWYFPALAAGRKLVDQQRANAIFSTSSPFTSHLIALALKRSTGLPWIADFRDPWIDNPTLTYPTRWHARWIALLEKSVCRTADQVLVTTPRARQALLDRLTDLTEDKVVCLPNGYDPQDFSTVEPVNTNPEIFSIVYSGSFYSQGRTPNNFLSALRKLIDSKLIPREQIQIHLAGWLGKPARLAIERSGISDRIVEHGYLPHQDSLRWLVGADLLLLINHPGKSGELVVPAKFYEYLGAGRPVLILSGQGAVTDLCIQLGIRNVVEPDDCDAIASAVLELFSLWQRGELTNTARTNGLHQYHRRDQASALANLVDLLV